MTDADKELFARLMAHVDRAERLHPGYACGPYEALGFIGQEYGELASAVTKREPEQRWMDEALDLLVVTWRFARKDYEMQEEQ